MTVEPEEVIQRYAFSHYGDLILADEPIFISGEKAYCSNLRSDYPLLIKDDRIPDKRSVHILKIGSLGTISFNQDSNVIRATSREECIDNLKLFLETWKKRAEEIVVSASADNLVRISRFRHFFDPIDSILISLWEENRILNEEIRIARAIDSQRKIILYLELLEGLKIVRKVENGYVAGNLYVSLRDKIPSENEFRDAMLSCIIRERYSTLRDIFKLTILEPTIHTDNCVYLPELETERPIYRSLDSIAQVYEQYYQRKINPLSLKLTLKRLEDAEAINHEENYYFGNEVLLKKMVRIKKAMPSINKELLAKA